MSAPRSGDAVRLLYVEDDATSAKLVRMIAEKEGYLVTHAPNEKECWRSVAEEVPGLFLIDLTLPDGSGLDLMSKLREKHPTVPAIVVTASDSIQDVIGAMQRGAVDYLTKPVDARRMLVSIANAVKLTTQQREIARLVSDVSEAYSSDHLVGASPAMDRVRQHIQRAASSEATVLIVGESGTGKELVARALHAASTRVAGPFVDVNSAALAETLLESELFGHEKGAFTSAVSRRRGKFEQADGGTIFLDEIGDMPLPTQAKMLRVLQERSFQRVGGDERITVNVRVICATNRNLEDDARKGTFRKDLFYRINTFVIEIPSLRERVTDIPELARHFLARSNRTEKRQVQGISEPAMKALCSHPWPGNVRELQHAIERGVLVCDADEIQPEHLPPAVLRDQAPTAPAGEADGLIEAVERLERSMILAAMDRNGWVKARAARTLGVTERILAYKMNNLGIEKPAWIRSPMSPTMRILYAEDDPVSIVSVRTMLSAEGYQVDPVTTGADCVEAAAQKPPDLCLLDLTLPDGSGLDVLRSLRQALPDLPVIIVTASESIRDAVAAIKLGAVDFITKPIDAQRLSVSIRNSLQLRQQKEEIVRLKVATGEGESKVAIDDILRDLVQRGGSDLHLKAGRPPMIRVSSDLIPSSFPVLDEVDVNAILRGVLGREGYRMLHEDFESDSSYELPGVARFRVNAFKRLGRFGAAFRTIPLTIPTIELMNLPPVLKDICKAPQGMVLVTGPTGSGKSTTLAAMIDHLNQTQPLHIITIEDPVEFVYTDGQSTITQRQLGNDVKSLHEALRRVLRQDPDVILMGEMRDKETMELAMHAAETGHLVFSTLHTNDAKQTLDRIVDAFPPEASHQVRSMLALTLQAVVSQRLVRRADGKGRVAAVEVMINSPNVRELISEGKIASIEKVIATSGDFYKMQTFNQALARLVMSKTVTEEEAAGCSTNPNDLKLMLRGITGGATTVVKPAPAAPSAPPAAPDPKPAPPAPGLKINRGY